MSEEIPDRALRCLACLGVVGAAIPSRNIAGERVFVLLLGSEMEELHLGQTHRALGNNVQIWEDVEVNSSLEVRRVRKAPILILVLSIMIVSLAGLVFGVYPVMVIGFGAPAFRHQTVYILTSAGHQPGFLSRVSETHDVLSSFSGAAIAAMNYAWLWNYASCWGAEPQNHRKINDELELYSLDNGLLRQNLP